MQSSLCTFKARLQPEVTSPVIIYTVQAANKISLFLSRLACISAKQIFLRNATEFLCISQVFPLFQVCYMPASVADISVHLSMWILPRTVRLPRAKPAGSTR